MPEPHFVTELLEQGFEVAVVKDATAGPRHPQWGDGYQAAMINYRFLAHAVLSTDEAVTWMGDAGVEPHDQHGGKQDTDQASEHCAGAVDISPFAAT